MVFPFADVISFYLGVLANLPGPFISFIAVSAALMLFGFVLHRVVSA